MAWETGKRPAIGAHYKSRFDHGNCKPLTVEATWENGAVCDNGSSYTAEQFSKFVQVGEDPQIDLPLVV